MDEKAHQLGIKEIFRTFLADPFKGLSSEEARVYGSLPTSGTKSSRMIESGVKKVTLRFMTSM